MSVSRSERVDFVCFRPLMLGTSVAEYIPCAATSGSNEVTGPKREYVSCAFSGTIQ